MKASDNQNLICCICGKELPNKFAVAGQCEEKDCGAVFCSMHWRNGNRKCREHGWKGEGGKKAPDIVNSRELDFDDITLNMKSGEGDSTTEQPDKKQSFLGRVFSKKTATQSEIDTDSSPQPEDGQMAKEQEKVTQSQEKELAKNASKSTARKAMAKTLELLKKVGSGTGALIAKLRNAKNPEAMLETFDSQMAANRERREKVSARVNELFKEITEKKKARETMPPARRRILDMELKNLLSAYKSAEEEMGVLLENEQVISKVRGRFLQMLAYDLRGIDEDTVDRLTDDLDEKAGDADAVLDAVSDMDRAGRRKNREDDKESLDDMLADFDMETDDEDADWNLDGAGNEAAEPEKNKQAEDPEL